MCRPCGEGFSPLDSLLGMEQIGHKMTPEMAAKIAYVGQFSSSFKDAAECFDYVAGQYISSSLIRQVTEETGKKVDEEQRESAKQAYAKPEEAVPAVLPKDRKSGTLYVMTDGSQVNTRKEDKEGSTWKEMKLGLVYNNAQIRTRKSGQAILTDKEYVTHFGGVNEFKPQLFDTAVKAGYGTYEQTAFIGDGAIWIWNLADEMFPDAVQVLDYYHMSENVHDYAKYLYPSDEAEMKQWASIVITNIESGKIDEALQMIPSTSQKKLPSGVPNLPVYLENNRNRMNYDELEKHGFKVGSGAIESGNKKVIQQRMKQSGMRWNMETGQSIATLRAKSASGRWKDVERLLNVS